MELSIIIPAKNEAASLPDLLARIRILYPKAEIIVVDDGSTDDTAAVCALHSANIISNPYSMGNGAAVKSGARAAKGKLLVFLDADGQHNPDDIERLLDKLKEGYTMVVGARSAKTQASFARRIANNTYNRLASVMTGYPIRDLTSGFRAVRAKQFRNFLYLLPNGFSYPTTITMALFRCGYPIAYIPIKAAQRRGKSNIRLFRDGFRFFMIILKIGALFSPMRFFLPISTSLFAAGLAYYIFTFLTIHRFTNMSAVIFMASLLTFLMGVLSEQISSLHYRNSEERRRTDD